RDHDGTTIHFCSTHCAAAFDTDPHRYAHGPSGAGHH
ncbi:MAG: YHS domain-containing protein, partial [Propionibacteriaceae bacterium]|nr:YHS domain-containing protein [Propionibacteriaceae bacterium]